jgi:ABC-type branched-subunit amino acid transport system substrate-binding protein
MGRRHRRRRRVAVALLAATTVAVVATASCSTREAPAVADGSCDTPGFTADKIRLGLVYPDTGALGDVLSSSRSGVEARIQLANEHGGIHGRKLTYEWRDDAGAPPTNSAAVRELVERKNVFGLIETTTAAGGGAGYLRDHGIPVAGLPAEALWADTRNRNMFAYAYLFTDGPSVDTFGKYVRAQGGTKAVVIKSDIAAGAQAVDTKIEESLTASDIKIVPRPFVFNPSVTNPRRLGEQIRDAGADVLTGALSARDFAAVMRGVRAAGARVKVVLSASTYDKSQLRGEGTALAGISTFLNYVPFEARTPAHQTYLAAMARYSPESQPPDQQISLVAYIVTDLFLHGLEVAGPCPTRAGFIDALRAVKGYNAGGLIAGQVDFSKDFGQLSTCYAFVRVNQAGTGYDVVPNNTPRARNLTQWCGERLDR